MADRLRRRPAKDDSGLTLIELIVALGLFSLFLSLLVGGVVAFTRVTTEARLDAQTSSAVGIAMKRVERSARYANSINYAGVVSGKSYVEWRVDAVSAPAGVTTCYQLRYLPTDGTIALRSWSASDAPSSATWSVILSGVRGAATTSYPFLTISAGANSNYQGLAMTVDAGQSSTAGTSTSSTVYAKNTTPDSTANAMDASGQSRDKVCTGAGFRP